MATLPINMVIKTLGDVYSRLFDHRPSLHGEINYFVKEFEERRNDRESDRLESCLEYSDSIRDQLQDVGELQLQYYLPDLLKQVNQAVESASRIEENQEKPERNVWLYERRQERVEEWSSFMATMCDKSTAIDKQTDGELARVRNYYTEMEKKLNIMDRIS